jgi:hypothetical protein
MKGHRRIKDDGTLETEYEASIRELFEELSIKFMRSKSAKTITKENIQLIGFNQTNFLQCHVDSRPNANDKSRCIGLFCVRVDEKTVKFNLKDNKENKVIINPCVTLKNKLKWEFSFCFRLADG